MAELFEKWRVLFHVRYYSVATLNLPDMVSEGSIRTLASPHGELAEGVLAVWDGPSPTQPILAPSSLSTSPVENLNISCISSFVPV